MFSWTASSPVLCHRRRCAATNQGGLRGGPEGHGARLRGAAVLHGGRARPQEAPTPGAVLPEVGWWRMTCGEREPFWYCLLIVLNVFEVKLGTGHIFKIDTHPKLPRFSTILFPKAEIYFPFQLFLFNVCTATFTLRRASTPLHFHTNYFYDFHLVSKNF